MKIGNKILLYFLIAPLIYLAFFFVRDHLISTSNGRLSSILELTSNTKILQEELLSLGVLEHQIDSYFMIGSEELSTAILEYPEISLFRITSATNVYKEIEESVGLDASEEEEYLKNLQVAFAELDKNLKSFVKTNEDSRDKFILNIKIMNVYDSIKKLEKLESRFIDFEAEELHELIMDNNKIVAEVSRLSKFISWFVFIVVLVLSYLLSRTITKPIITLRDATIAIKEGDLDTKIRIDAQDEIGELANAFRLMTANLKKKEEELKKYSRDLERKIRERTEEFEVKNIELERINKFMVDRELKMIELKKEIAELKAKSG